LLLTHPIERLELDEMVEMVEKHITERDEFEVEELEVHYDMGEVDEVEKKDLRQIDQVVLVEREEHLEEFDELRIDELVDCQPDEVVDETVDEYERMLTG